MGNCCSSDRGDYYMRSDDVDLGLVRFTGDIRTGDLLLLDDNYAFILKPVIREVSPRTPVLVATAVRTSEDDLYQLHLSSMVAAVAYGGYSKVRVRRLTAASRRQRGVCLDYNKIIEAVRGVQCCSTVSDLFISLYRTLGFRVRLGPSTNRFPECLPFSLPQVVPVPEMKVGPVITGEVPFYHGWTTKGVTDKTHKTLKEMLPLLQTGDIVLMCGVTIGGAMIRVLDRAKYSHVGVVVRDPWIDRPCIWESTGNSANMVDIDTGAVVRGVGLVPLEDKLRTGWCSPVAVRRLKISDENRKELDEIAVNLRCKYKGRLYEEHPTELIKAAVDFGEDYIPLFKNVGGEESLETIFCSELVALAYQWFKLVGDDYPANEYTPEDFADSRRLQLNQAELEEEVYVDISQ